MSLPIETARLLLRRFEDRDVADILEYSRDADFWVSRILPWEPTEESLRAFWETQHGLDLAADPAWLDLVVELKRTGKVIGTVGIGVAKHGPTAAGSSTAQAYKTGMVGWVFGGPYQGRGYATEAAQALMAYGFGRMGLHRISARTGADNERSWRLMERLGMRREAHFVESHIVNDEWRDEYVYAVLVDEWRASGGHGQKVGRNAILAPGAREALRG